MKSYLRFLSRNKLYTAIMAAGLSVSLAFVIIMSCYVWQNLSVNRYYPDADRIYCIGRKGTTHSSFNLGQILEDRFPEVEMSATAMNRFSKFSAGDVLVEKTGFMGVDPDFFDMFPTRFVYGSKEAFNDLGNVIITGKLADRLGGEKALGMQLRDEFQRQDYTIGAVVEGFEDTVFDNVEVIINTRSPRFDRSRSEQLGMFSSGMFTFIRTSEDTDISELQKKIEAMYAEVVNDKAEGDCFSFTRLDKLYLADTNDGKTGLKKGNKGLMTAFSIIVVFLLISAIFNYINLSTALTGKRSKETATRMLLGETRKEIIRTNLMESLCFMSVCMCLAFLIAYLCLPLINRLVGSPIPIEMKFSHGYIFMYLVIMGICAVFCGLAPTFISIRFKPIDVIRGSFRYQSKRIFSKAFIIIQNCIAVIIIAVSLTMQAQIKHMTDMPLNARTEGLYMVRTNSTEVLARLSGLPYLGKIGKSEGRPGQSYMTLGVPVNEDRTKSLTFNMCNCDSTAFGLFDFKIVKNYGQPGNVGVWFTESAFRALELDEATPVIPESLKWYCRNPVVAGIIEDVKFSSAINLNPDHLGMVHLVQESQMRPSADLITEVIDLSKENIKELNTLCEAETKKVLGPFAPMMSGYIPDLMERDYKDIRNQLTMIKIFMIIAIMLSALGQLATSTYYTNEKSKDIGIRKVFGGTVGSESRRTVSEYMLYCIIAAVIAIPASVFICGRYLEAFVYRMPSMPWIYVAATLAVFAISLASILWQTLRAARTNPAEALKKE